MKTLGMEIINPTGVITEPVSYVWDNADRLPCKAIIDFDDFKLLLRLAYVGVNFLGEKVYGTSTTVDSIIETLRNKSIDQDNVLKLVEYDR